MQIACVLIALKLVGAADVPLSSIVIIGLAEAFVRVVYSTVARALS